MKKKQDKSKLALRTQTIRPLTTDSLTAVGGGSAGPQLQGFIMKDTIIIKTSSR